MSATDKATQTTPDELDAIRQDLVARLEKQRRAFLADGPPDAETRIDRLDRTIAMIADHQQEIVDAIVADFGARSPHATRIADIAAPVSAMRYAKRNLKRWMKPHRRKVPFLFKSYGVTAWIQYQPLGVVGIISPWNYPFVLTMIPLADVLAAGNRAMIKPSELTPETSALMARLIADAFDETEVTVVTGGPEVGDAFSRLRFDHIIYTGSTRVGRMVMRAAAENLVPVTLELGGKSPVIIGRKGNLSLAVRRITMAKMTNAGQICMAPDYVFLPAAHLDRFVDLVESSVKRMFPTLRDNPDYTSVVNDRHHQRLLGYLADAEAKGARLVEVNPAGEDFSDQRSHKMPLTLVLDPTDDMVVMQEEIFGPILPVMTYGHVNEAIEYIAAHPRPLALYCFGSDDAERDHVLLHTTSGGVTVNDAMMHYNMPDLPFGGVGASGTGAYRGVHGFRTFSHAKAVCKVPAVDIPNPAEPPLGTKADVLATIMMKT